MVSDLIRCQLPLRKKCDIFIRHRCKIIYPRTCGIGIPTGENVARAHRRLRCCKRGTRLLLDGRNRTAAVGIEGDGTHIRVFRGGYTNISRILLCAIGKNQPKVIIGIHISIRNTHTLVPLEGFDPISFRPLIFGVILLIDLKRRKSILPLDSAEIYWRFGSIEICRIKVAVHDGKGCTVANSGIAIGCTKRDIHAHDVLQNKHGVTRVHLVVRIVYIRENALGGGKIRHTHDRLLDQHRVTRGNISIHIGITHRIKGYSHARLAIDIQQVIGSHGNILTTNEKQCRNTAFVGGKAAKHYNILVVGKIAYRLGKRNDHRSTGRHAKCRVLIRFLSADSNRQKENKHQQNNR